MPHGNTGSGSPCWWRDNFFCSCCPSTFPNAAWLRGGRYIHGTASAIDEAGLGTLEVGELASAEIGAGVMSDR